MEIETRRLKIVALNNEELAALCTGKRGRDVLPSLLPMSAETDGHLLAAYGEMYEQCLAHPDEQLWHTIMLIILRDENISVGSIGFLGAPDKNGTAELGYGIDEEYRCRGIASEALLTVCKWAFSNGARRLAAETMADNAASGAVLKKCGFAQRGECDGNLQYSLEKHSV